MLKEMEAFGFFIEKNTNDRLKRQLLSVGVAAQHAKDHYLGSSFGAGKVGDFVQITFHYSLNFPCSDACVLCLCSNHFPPIPIFVPQSSPKRPKPNLRPPFTCPSLNLPHSCRRAVASFHVQGRERLTLSRRIACQVLPHRNHHFLWLHLFFI